MLKPNILKAQCEAFEHISDDGKRCEPLGKNKLL